MTPLGGPVCPACPGTPQASPQSFVICAVMPSSPGLTLVPRRLLPTRTLSSLFLPCDGVFRSWLWFPERPLTSVAQLGFLFCEVSLFRNVCCLLTVVSDGLGSVLPIPPELWGTLSSRPLSEASSRESPQAAPECPQERGWCPLGVRPPLLSVDSGEGCPELAPGRPWSLSGLLTAPCPPCDLCLRLDFKAAGLCGCSPLAFWFHFPGVTHLGFDRHQHCKI